MRVAMYWHNGRSLGHTAEVAKISHAIEKGMPDDYLVGVTGAYKGLDMLADKMDVVKLPGFANFDKLSGWNYTGKQGMQPEELFKCRSEMIHCFMNNYEPDLFMVNHVPYGLYDELKPTLELKPRGKRILTLRGILFDREKTNREYFKGDAAKWIIDKYDALFVHIDPSIFAIEDNYDIPSELLNRIQYTGYLTCKNSMSKEEARKCLNIDEGKKIIVASMGGGQGAIEIWDNILKGLKENSDNYDEAYLITGPYLEEDDYKKMKSLEEEDESIKIIKYVNNMQTWMIACDLFIGAAGSNMIGEVLATGCNSILIPRQVREIEQHLHSKILSEKGIVRMCELGDVLDGELSKVITLGLKEPICEKSNILMNGLDRYTDYIKKWYER
ncbi:glycosyltransferase family protein [Eubacterium sp.]